MKKNNFIVTFIATLLLSTFAYAKDITITGAGATFVAPLISKWSEEYKKFLAIVLITHQLVQVVALNKSEKKRLILAQQTLL